MEIMKKTLLWLMVAVFALFLGALLFGYDGLLNGVELAIITALVLMGLFVGFILVSSRAHKKGGDQP